MDGSRIDLQVTVADTGLGVPEDQLETIFEAFTQGASFETRKHGGTGLGLAITRELVGLLGGEVKAASKLGVGSKFSFNLPLALPLGAQPPVISFGEGVRGVLIVQDNEAAAKATASLLQAAGIRTWFARTGHQAIDAAAIDEFTLILVDQSLPDMSGPMLVNRLRSSRNANASRIILMT